MQTPLSSKRTLPIESHLTVIDAMITNQTSAMDKLNKYIEQVRHPSTSFSLVVSARDKVCQSLRALEAARLVVSAIPSSKD